MEDGMGIMITEISVSEFLKIKVILKKYFIHYYLCCVRNETLHIIASMVRHAYMGHGELEQKLEQIS